MPLEINKSTPIEAGLIADRRLLLTADHRLVEEGSPDAAFQLAAPGGMIEAADVARLGLELKDGKISQKNPPVGLPAPGGSLLNPKGAVEAAVKDRLKADWEVRVKEETDKEIEKVKGEVADERNAPALALNRAGAISKDALRRRGEVSSNPEQERSAAAVEAALKSPTKSAQETGKSSSTKAARKRGK